MGRKIGKGEKVLSVMQLRMMARVRPKGPSGCGWADIRRPCCYIGPDGKGCSRDAEFEIVPVGEGVDYLDFTDACEEHVGALLGDINGAATHFEVWPRPMPSAEDAPEQE